MSKAIGLLVGALLSVCLFAGLNQAHAADLSIVLAGNSKHFGKHKDGLNEHNPGIGVEVREGGLHAGVLTYRDSYYNQAVTAYVGYRAEIVRSGNFALGAGLRVGYLRGSGYDGLVALPTLVGSYKRSAIEVFVVPPHGQHAGLVGTFFRHDF